MQNLEPHSLLAPFGRWNGDDLHSLRCQNDFPHKNRAAKWKTFNFF